ncbi:MAG: hypothetical protein HY903_20590 [Deltaproteobacteria bacterium]|nr:hypothetical protein [Deltaproteobacteria bacterium]
MQSWRWLSLCSTLAACGTESAASIAEIGWTFNYKDYTDSTKPDDLRGCNNQAAIPDTSAPPYDAISKVHVLIKDPQGQVPGVDQEYDCGIGMDGRVPVRGIVRQTYSLTLEAKNAAGVVLYRFVEPKLDLTGFISTTYQMPTATGELAFYPTFPGADPCPSAVANILIQASNNDFPDLTTETLSQPACEQGFSGLQPRQIYLRALPVTIDTDTFKTFNPFTLTLKAQDSGNAALYCATVAARPVRPGNNSLGGNVNLSSSCP